MQTIDIRDVIYQRNRKGWEKMARDIDNQLIEAILMRCGGRKKKIKRPR